MIKLNCRLEQLDISDSDSEEITKCGKIDIKTVRNRKTWMQNPTDLHVAVFQKNEDLIKQLLQLNADPSAKSRLNEHTFAQTFNYDKKKKTWIPSGYEGRHIVSSSSGDYTAGELAERVGCNESIKLMLKL